MLVSITQIEHFLPKSKVDRGFEDTLCGAYDCPRKILSDILSLIFC